MGVLSSTASQASALIQTQSQQNQAKLEDDLNKFLNLLVTQLKNQDPLEPMDATEFTSQLVQFASVEQQIYQNSNLEKLVEAAHVTQVSNLANYLGTTIEAQTDYMNLLNSAATFSFNLLDQASANSITIKDAAGTTVRTLTGDLTTGRHEITWDGKDDNANQLEDGMYSFAVNALNKDGVSIEYSRSVIGRVTAAGSDAGSVRLYLGDVKVSLDDILSVKETPVAATPDP